MSASIPPASTRRFLLLLVFLSAAMLALAIVQRDRALERVYEDAQQRAELYAGPVLGNSLGPRDVAAPLTEERSRDVLAEIQGSIVVDPAVARVRLWGSDGTLLFSTDPSDQPGNVSGDPAIDAAAHGRTGSRLASEPLSGSSVSTDTVDTSLFQTFAPLRVRGNGGVFGAVEIEQFASVLEDRANDPWWIVQTVASAVTVLLALIALISVARGMRRPRRAKDERAGGKRSRRRAVGLDGDPDALRERLERATTRANEAEAAAASNESRLQQVTNRLETLEKQSSDERVEELKESLRRSEAERAMLRAGRPETVLEAEMRQLRGQLRDAQSLAKAAEAMVPGGGDLTVVKEQLSAASREVDRAVERAKVAEGRANAAEDEARAAGDMATAAERRIDLLEAKLQELAAAGLVAADGAELADVRKLLVEADERAAELERRAVEAESRLADPQLEAPSEELLAALEQRVVGAEERAQEAETRLRAFEDQGSERESVFRQRLGISSAGRKHSPQPQQDGVDEPEFDIRAAIARGLRAPLTRATGLALSLQGAMQSIEGRDMLRQLSASLRRLDRLAADLHDVHRIADGSLPLNKRKTDLADLVSTTVEETDRLEDRLVRVDADRVHASVDPDRVRQIVEGMLDAARERTRSGAAIVIRVRDTDAGGRVSVEDDNRTPAVVGPELSLAIRLAELHGTELTVDGSSFRVVFPKDERF